MTLRQEQVHGTTYYLYRCTVHFVVYLSNTQTNAHIHSFISIQP